jgi:hypothetical protein
MAVAGGMVAGYNPLMDTAGRARTRRYVEQLDARRRTLADELEDDIAPVRGLTLRERGAWIVSACRSAWAIIRSRPDGSRIVQDQEPPADDLPAKWRRLMARQRADAKGGS